MRIFILSVDGDPRRVGKTSSFPRGYTPSRPIYKIKKYNAGWSLLFRLYSRTRPII